MVYLALNSFINFFSLLSFRQLVPDWLRNLLAVVVSYFLSKDHVEVVEYEEGFEVKQVKAFLECLPILHKNAFWIPWAIAGFGISIF